MADREHFWKLAHLSDRQLLERLQGALRTHRCTLAELVAHLGEVEERRLHLAAAHSSMFSYCVQHLGMSEDEACRRIDLARLARKFPILFGELASGCISLSVALILKPVLTPDNHAELFAAARGASLRAARELLAARFPSPDVPSRMRKLPQRSLAGALPVAAANLAQLIPVADANLATPIFAATADVAVAMPAAVSATAILTPVAKVFPERADPTAAATTAPGGSSSPQAARSPALEHGLLAEVSAQSLLRAPPAPDGASHPPAQCWVPRYTDPRQRIDPLSPERYRIQFTGDASLKQKLELARDLLRHSNPSGDLGPVVSRALDLLLQELLQRRFGARRKDTPRRAARPASHAAPTAAAPTGAASEALQPLALPPATLAPAPSAKARCAMTPSAATPSAARRATAPAATTPTSSIARAARRTVLERDGLGCCWVDGTGKRCGSTAWLELDHDRPAGKGGSSEPENLRLLCRAHNRFAAERAYGRAHVERAIRARQDGVKRRSPSGPPPSSSPAPT